MSKRKVHEKELRLADNSSASSGVAASLNQVEGVSTKKVRFAFKAVAFIAAVITLSWFFEGMREIGKEVSLVGVAYLFFGTTLTILLLLIQGYWIYIEEKSKGTLVKKIKLFDKIERASNAASQKRDGTDSSETRRGDR
ncbi:MAG TPA: hypothetical protein V6D17_12230 [Candidatus Obscuribacterales bacterium]